MRAYLKDSKPNVLFYMVTLMVMILVYGSIYGYSLVSVKNVTVSDIDKYIEMKTKSKFVSDVLQKNNIILSEADYVEPPMETLLEEGMDIKVTRSFPITLIADGSEAKVFVTKDRVSDILKSQGIKLGDLDRVRPSLNSKMAEGDTLIVTRVIEEKMTVTVEVPFLTEQNMTYKLDPGAIKVVTEGSDGRKSVVYKVKYEDGVLVSKDIIDEKIINPVVNRVVNKGKEKLFVTNRGKPFKVGKSMIMESTAYDLSYASCGKYPDHPQYGITRSGTRARPGTIAVDPRIIPLGTTVYVESITGGVDYGFAIAEDTGSAIKGHIIDLFIESNREALRYGRRNVKVYIIDDEVPDELIVGYGDR